MPAVKQELKDEKTIAVDPRKEYVAGGQLGGTYFGNGSSATTLSGLNEPKESYHSAKTYEQMTKDPKIAKALTLLTISTLGDGIELLPAVPESHEDYEVASEIAEFCDKALKELDVPLRYTLEQMMEALVYGHKIAEITYKTTTVNGFPGIYLVPATIKVKKLDTVRFVVDDKGNILGLAAKNLDLKGSSLENDATTQAAKGGLGLTRGANGQAYIDGKALLPREKFLVLTIKGKDGDPRGQSMLAPAFKVWHLKTQIWPEYLRYLLLCAIPLLVGYTPENDAGVKELLRGADGQPARDPATGNFIEANPVEHMRDALLNARDGEVLAVKGGSKIQEIGAQGAGTPFFKAIELFDSQMETAILLQTLATSEGIHQNRAASTMHMSVLDQLVWWLKGIVVDMLVSDLLRPTVRFNFGDDALDLVPKATLGDTERREFSTDAAAVAALYKAGYLQPDQLKQTDAMLGLGIRQTVDPLQLIQQLQAAGVSIVAVPPPAEQAAQIQAGPGGGVAPVPVAPSGVALPVGKSLSSDSNNGRKLNRGGNVKFPAAGRVKAKLNKSPKNETFPSSINTKP